MKERKKEEEARTDLVLFEHDLDKLLTRGVRVERRFLHTRSSLLLLRRACGRVLDCVCVCGCLSVCLSFFLRLG